MCSFMYYDCNSFMYYDCNSGGLSIGNRGLGSEGGLQSVVVTVIPVLCGQG